jgi:hypothetical protein
VLCTFRIHAMRHQNSRMCSLLLTLEKSASRSVLVMEKGRFPTKTFLAFCAEDGADGADGDGASMSDTWGGGQVPTKKERCARGQIRPAAEPS